MPAPPAITLGFTVFRPETAPFAARAMENHDLIVLEEPHTPGFEEMLAGELPVDEYLMLTDFEFPEYATAQCRTLQALHARGAAVLQVHPWMDELAGIHEFFAAGNGPGDIPTGGRPWAVYIREREWSAKLLAFYAAAGKKDFDGILEAVNDFAMADAAKISDMDRDRAAALADILPAQGRAYVECGAIHHDMVGLMIRVLGHGRVRTVHLMEEACLARHGRRRLIPPGDLLTFRHLLGAPRDRAVESLLAARAVVYNRLMEKDESFESDSPYPHMDAEAVVLQIVDGLSMEQCRDLFGRIQHIGVRESLDLALGKKN
ncbi:hypothetical protein [Desulfomicrobium escambiense]|uniref:hypothetical protein n=1 Tax=Desulfomicrobium escambiense TaxID=29503 RepID=UPI0004176708|nr:hypothetical protein [Desulfomicrobium escambiense]